MDKEVIDCLIYLLNKSYFAKIILDGDYSKDVYDIIDRYDELNFDEVSYDVDIRDGNIGTLKIAFHKRWSNEHE